MQQARHLSPLAQAARARREQAARGDLAPVRRVAPKGHLSEAAAARRAGRFYRWRPTAPQARMLGLEVPRRLLRGPNQIGKTEAMCADVVDIMLGTGRWQPARPVKHPPPVDVWVVCTSWKQSLIVQRKLFAMLPGGQLDPKSKYTGKRGFTGQSFQTRNGSLCTIVTINQNTEDLASATLDAVFVDEVPTQEAWGELIARVRHKGGQIAVYFTPINKPVEWVKEAVAAGQIVEVHTGLSLEAVHPIGALRPFQTQAQIDEFLGDLPPWQRAQRGHGEWEGATEGRWLADFDPLKHSKATRPSGDGWLLAVGFDYGLRPGKMAASLVAVRNGYTARPEVVWLDEAAAGKDETWDETELVRRTLLVLRRNGIDYDDVDEWVGDRSAVGKGGKVSNRDMRAHLAAALSRSWSEVKEIKVPRKGAGSLAYGCGLMNALFKRDRAIINPRCEGLLRFASHFAGDPRDTDKDAGDAHRYAFLALVRPSSWYRLAAAA